jgi:hypothetical protein
MNPLKEALSSKNEMILVLPSGFFFLFNGSCPRPKIRAVGKETDAF